MVALSPRRASDIAHDILVGHFFLLPKQTENITAALSLDFTLRGTTISLATG